jgi:hypothetical protein
MNDSGMLTQVKIVGTSSAREVAYTDAWTPLVLTSAVVVYAENQLHHFFDSLVV